METKLPQRKHTRLKNKDVYSFSNTIVHITIGTSQKKPFFKNSEYAQAACEIIKDLAIEKGNKLYAYCIMPDHIHILVQASEGCSIINYVKLIKGRFSVCCRKKGWDLRLQPGFYDHIIRKDEDLETVTRYILGNPVRSRIVRSINEYPFNGSLVFEL